MCSYAHVRPCVHVINTGQVDKWMHSEMKNVPKILLLSKKKSVPGDGVLVAALLGQMGYWSSARVDLDWTVRDGICYSLCLYGSVIS